MRMRWSTKTVCVRKTKISNDSYPFNFIVIHIIAMHPSLLLGQHSRNYFEQTRCESELHDDVIHVFVSDLDGCL